MAGRSRPDNGPGCHEALPWRLPLKARRLRRASWLERAEQGARESGTPFTSFFMPSEMLEVYLRSRLSENPERVGSGTAQALLRG